MIKKIDILGIKIDNYTVREAMLQVEMYLNSTEMNTIETISMEMLVRAGNDVEVKECIEQLDLAIIGEKDILKAAGVESAQRMKETEENEFFTEFMKRIVRNNKTVYLFGETKEQVELLKDFLAERQNRINVTGSYSLEECADDLDKAVNEMNIAAPDVLISILKTPEQEYFLKQNKGKLCAKIWYGLGVDYEKRKGVLGVKDAAKKILHKGMLHTMLSKYKDNK